LILGFGFSLCAHSFCSFQYHDERVTGFRTPFLKNFRPDLTANGR